MWSKITRVFKRILRIRFDANVEACVLLYAQDMFTTAYVPCEELDKALAASYVQHL